MNTLPEHLKPSLLELLLSVADDKLILGHHNSDWTGLGPILEEDIAFSSLAQDEIAHAQAIYRLAGEMAERSEDELAFGRPPEEFRCATVIEPADDFDWAVAIVRQFFCDHFDLLRLRRLAQSSWKPLADLASRIAAEEQVHVDHADSWIRRLATGTDESRTRILAAFEKLAPLAPTLFEPVDGQDVLEKEGIYPTGDGEMFNEWQAAIIAALAPARVSIELQPFGTAKKAGRRGVHTDALTELLDEMCEVYRIEPGAAW
jgi:ring-1,2-phenylacetyl-CoA epoxidase subunit PaaC